MHKSKRFGQGEVSGSGKSEGQSPNSINAKKLLAKAHTRFEKTGNAQSKALKKKMK